MQIAYLESPASAHDAGRREIIAFTCDQCGAPLSAAYDHPIRLIELRETVSSSGRSFTQEIVNAKSLPGPRPSGVCNACAMRNIVAGRRYRSTIPEGPAVGPGAIMRTGPLRLGYGVEPIVERPGGMALLVGLARRHAGGDFGSHGDFDKAGSLTPEGYAADPLAPIADRNAMAIKLGEGTVQSEYQDADGNPIKLWTELQVGPDSQPETLIYRSGDVESPR